MSFLLASRKYVLWFSHQKFELIPDQEAEMGKFNIMQLFIIKM